MDTRRLHYFLVLAEELHFGRAALRLAISQPPLSVSIRQLEESIGAKLFERSHQQVRLTAAGKALIPAAQALLDRMESMLLEVQNVAHGVTGHLRIGYVGALLYQGLPELMQQFQQRHAGMQLSMRELNTCNQLSELAHGSLDAGFIHTSPCPQASPHCVFPTTGWHSAYRCSIRWLLSVSWRSTSSKRSHLSSWRADFPRVITTAFSQYCWPQILSPTRAGRHATGWASWRWWRAVAVSHWSPPACVLPRWPASAIARCRRVRCCCPRSASGTALNNGRCSPH
ncbi:LysR family transcriptional regulator [Erwinia aphidicola]